jgi:hypothetical protein
VHRDEPQFRFAEFGLRIVVRRGHVDLSRERPALASGCAALLAGTR